MIYEHAAHGMMARKKDDFFSFGKLEVGDLEIRARYKKTQRFDDDPFHGKSGFNAARDDSNNSSSSSCHEFNGQDPGRHDDGENTLSEVGVLLYPSLAACGTTATGS